MTKAIYPGSFDPITNGHIDIIQRGLTIFDEIVVAIAHNVRKQGLFDVHERLELIQESLAGETRVTVDAFDGLLVEYAQNVGAKALIRGLRAVSDFEYEFQMANMNRKLNKNIDTVFMMTGAGHFYLSSSLVREVAALNGDIADLVPPPVARALQKRFSK